MSRVPGVRPLRRAIPAALAFALCAALAGPAAATQPDTAWTLDGARYAGLRGRRAVVRFTAPDSLVARRVLGVLDGQPPLPGLAPDVPGGITAVLAHTPDALDEITGGQVPEWRAGVAIPELGLLVVPTGEGPRILDPGGLRVLRHEWAHLGLHQALGGLRIPRWFDEGYAQWASGGWDASDAWRLRILLAVGGAPPLDSLSLAWPRERGSAEGAYLLAASAVSFLLEGSGERGLALLMARWREGRSFDGALRATFGVTTGQFEEDWRRHVRKRYGWLFVASRSAVFWMLLALVLLFMARTRQARNRARMARLRAGEVPDAPA
ncbi:MAG: hypothetical protein FIA95_11420, partial [Gemmatimonadetes bacterium]|nr:hypothetical protein [Gemmatimonadota bacterium]